MSQEKDARPKWVMRRGFNWASSRENLTLLYANNTGADQPVHPRILVSTFVIRLLEIMISTLASCKIAIF